MLITVHVPLPLPRIPAAFSRFAICSYVWRFDRRESAHVIPAAPARCGTVRIRVIIAIDGPALRLALCLQMAHVSLILSSMISHSHWLTLASIFAILLSASPRHNNQLFCFPAAPLPLISLCDDVS